MERKGSEGFEQALRECANERIHQIGHIQSHGAMLVFEADAQYVVHQVSENLADFVDLPTGSAVGQPLAKLLGEPASTQVMNLVRVARAKHCAAGVVVVTRGGVSVDLQAYVYAADGQWALELEHDEGTHQEAQLAQLQLQFQQTLLEFDLDADLTQYLNEVAKLVRRLTGYDSVMIYRFTARWDGEIVAQDRLDTAPSYLGLHFPASDIPPQARRLYAVNMVRIVADVNSQSVPIAPALNPQTGEPLDMTYSALRSLSPIHLEYLRNIGVSASMVISLMQDGQLWGMVACHHMTPKRVSIAMRESAIFISRMISAKLSAIAAIEQRARVDRANSMVSELVKSMALDDLAVALHKLMPRLTSLLDATGLIIVIDGQPHVHGTTPGPEAVRALLDWLGERPSTAEVFASDELGQQFAPALSYADIASGLLTTALSRDTHNSIVWLRQEKPLTVKWAGNYATGLTQNAAGDFRLTPRKSFEIWCETWRGRSEPWSSSDTGIAAMLSLSVPEALAKKHKLEAEQERFRQAHQISENAVRQYNKLTSAIPGVVYQFLVSPNGNWTFLYLSDYILELFEVSPEDAYRDHKVITNCIIPEHRESHLASVQSANQTLTPWVHEHLIQTQSGARKWVRGQALPEVQADGSVLWHGILTDITEKTEIELALAESRRLSQEKEDRLALAVIHNGIGIWDWNLQTLEMIWDDSMFALYHLRREEFSGAVDAWEKSLHPDDRARAQREVQEAIEGAKPFDTEFRVRWPNDEIRCIKAVAKVFRDESGKPLRMLGTNIDISERKQTEMELRNSEERLSFVMRGTNDGIWDWDLVRNELYYSPRWWSMLGYTEGELASDADLWLRLLHPDDLERVNRIFAAALAGSADTYVVEFRLLHKGGHYLPVLSRGFILRDETGKALRVCGANTDIFERKRIEHELMESEKKFRLIAENTSDGITIFDKQGHIQYVSPSVSKQLGYSEQEEMARTSADVLAMIDPEGRDLLFQTISEAIQSKKPGLIYSYRVKHKAGHYVWREDNTNFRYTSAGEYDGAYVVSRDITERRRMEEAVRQLAYFDPLTQLPNRRMLNDRLSQIMAASKRSGRHAAVMILDLDNFKPLNDQHGHLVGDLLLVEVAQRLIACVREVDTVARFGGDEFVVMLSDLDEDKAESQRLAKVIAEKIRVSLATPYVLAIHKEGQLLTQVEHHCSASIGVVLFVDHETDQEDILKWADASMYLAKDAGRNAIWFYEAKGRV